MKVVDRLWHIGCHPSEALFNTPTIKNSTNFWILLTLTKLWNCNNRKLFLCQPQKLAKTQPAFWTAIFHDKFTLHETNNLSIEKINLLLINNCRKPFLQSVFMLLWSLLLQLALINYFYSIYVTTLEDNVFYKSLSLPWGSFQLPCSCAVWNRQFEIGPYFNFYLHNILIPKLKYNANTKAPTKVKLS